MDSTEKNTSLTKNIATELITKSCFENVGSTYSYCPGKCLISSLTVNILLNSKDAAIAAIKELGKGADFAELATKHSVGPSKSVGGDLGWFEPEQMVPEFSAATEKLADGAYTQEPVKTTFGWHVILREESRDVAQPDFETARPELEQQIRQQHVAQLIKQIREKANIEVQQLEGSE